VRLLVVLAVVALILVGVGYAFAGAENTLAPGTEIGGVDVGGMSVGGARALLERRAASLANVPVTFVAAGRAWRIRPYELGVTGDWEAAVDAAHDDAGGFGFVRGYRRLALAVFPDRISPTAHAYDAAVAYEVGLLAKAIDRPARDARLAKRELRFAVVPGQDGVQLDQSGAARVIVHALAGFGRAPVALPVRLTHPRLVAADLQAARALDQQIVSAPVTLVLGGKSRQLSRWQLAAMLLLQRDAHAKPALGGPAANAYFAKLDRTVSHPPRDATWAVDGSRVRLVAAQPGIGLYVLQTTQAVLRAAQLPTGRVAHLVVGRVAPKRSTAAARAMGITGVVGSYETFYGGVPNRIHNVDLVSHLIDDKLIAPGATFSFNQTTGDRTAAKGFLVAPVIINGELGTGLGGGVCQVSTTVFNAAYEAGLPITARTNHALYISHYPLGRDATVDYPDTDLKFVNDTPHWLLLRTFVGYSSLVVSLYGTPQHRRVVSIAAPLRVTSPPPVKRTLDRQLKPGQVVVVDSGVPAQSTQVRRLVYAPSGKLLDDTTWYSNYTAVPELVSFGPKKKKVPAAAPVTAAVGATAATGKLQP
jgi:vancomycin resistance protein YoaR